MKKLRNALMHRRDVVSGRLIINILEKADPDALVHSIAVAEIARIIGENYELETGLRDELWLAALLHDIGKLGIPSHILGKSKLSDTERAYLEKHVHIGKYMTDRFFSGGALGRAVEAHHERFDGKGYPSGMAGKDIPVYARIISIADYYDTARSAGWLLNRRSHDAVMREIADGAGKRFDPALASCSFMAGVRIQLSHKQVHATPREELRRWL